MSAPQEPPGTDRELARGLYRGCWVWWIGFVHDHAVAVTAAVLLAALATGAHVATHLGINTDTEDLLSAELPYQRDALETDALFPQFTENVLIVVDGGDADGVQDAADALVARLREQPELFGSVFDPAADPFLRRHGLLYLDVAELEALTNRLAEAQPLLGTLWRSPDLAGLASVLGQAVEQIQEEGEAPLELAPALGSVAEVVEAQIDGRPGRLSWQELMAGAAAEAPERRLVLIQPVTEYGTLAPGERALEALRTTVRELGLEERHGVRVRFTGSLALAQEELSTVVGGMEVSAALSLALTVGLLLWGLRSPRLVMATVIPLLAGLVFTAGFATVTVGRLNLLSVAFAVLFIGLAEDFGNHLGLRYQEELDAGTPHREALRRAAAGECGSLTLAAVAAAIGFASFLPTDYRGLGELGLISAGGMFVALACNATLQPALLTLAPPAPRPAHAAARRASTAGRALRAHAPAVCAAAVAIGLGSAALATRVRFDFDPFNLRDPGTEGMRALSDLMDDPRTSPYAITVLADDLAAAEDLAARLERLPEVHGTASLADFVPGGQAEKLAMIERAGLFLLPAFFAEREPPPAPEAVRAALADLRRQLETWTTLPASGAPPAPPEAARLATALARLDLDPGALAELETRLLGTLPGRLAALMEALGAGPVTLADLPADLRERGVAPDGRARLQVFPAEDLRDPAALERFVGAVRTEAPRATGAPVVILESGRAVVRAFALAGALTVVAIALLLSVVLASARDLLLVFAPLALSALLTVAASVVLGVPFNFANVIVLPLQFGLGVAGAVHLVIRERHEGGAAAVLRTSTPRAVTFSALSTIGSFGTIALSQHPGTASMGILLSVSIALTLACTLVVLPALMEWSVRRRTAAARSARDAEAVLP